MTSFLIVILQFLILRASKRLASQRANSEMPCWLTAKALSMSRMAAVPNKSIGDAFIIGSKKVVVQARLSPGTFTSPKKLSIYMNPTFQSLQHFMATLKRLKD